MRYYFLFFLTLLQVLPVFAQSKVDSLHTELSNATSPIDSVMVIKKIAAYYNLKDRKEFERYVRLLDSISQKSNDPYINGTSHKFKSVLAKNNKDFKLSAQEAKSAISAFIIINDTLEINTSLYGLFEAYRKLHQPNNVKTSFQEYQHYLTPNWEFEYHYQFARYYLNRGQYKESITSLETALSIEDILLIDDQRLGKAYYKLSQVYNDLNDDNSALDNITIAIEKLNPKKNYTLYGSAYTALGEIYKNKNEHEKALIAYDSAIVYYKVKNRAKTISKVLSAKSISYLNLKEYGKAESTIRQAINLHKTEKDNRALAFAYSRLGNILFRIDKQSDSAVYYMNESLKIAREYNLKSAIKASHYNLNNFQYERGEYKEARNNLVQAYRYTDTLYSEKLNSRVKDIEFKLERIEDKNTILQKEKEINQQKIKEQKTKITLLVIGFISAILFGIVIYLRRKNLQQKVVLQEYMLEAQKLRQNMFHLQEGHQLAISSSKQYNRELQEQLSQKEHSLAEVQKQLYSRHLLYDEQEFRSHLGRKYNISEHPHLIRIWESIISGYTVEEYALKEKANANTVKKWRTALYKQIKQEHNISSKLTDVRAVIIYVNELRFFEQYNQPLGSQSEE